MSLSKRGRFSGTNPALAECIGDDALIKKPQQPVVSLFKPNFEIVCSWAEPSSFA